MEAERTEGITETKVQHLYITQYQLHKEHGIGKATISRAVKSGRLQLHHRPDGRDLVFLPQALQVFADKVKGRAELVETTPQRSETAVTGTSQIALVELMELRTELALARQELKHKDEIIERIEAHKDEIDRERNRLRDENTTLKALPAPAPRKKLFGIF